MRTAFCRKSLGGLLAPLLVAIVIETATAQDLGTDIAGLNLCLWGDCEARGAYAADPYGFTNPATMPVGSLPYLQRGVISSGSYFRLNSGGVGVHIGSGSATAVAAPWVFQVSAIYAEGGGALPVLSGTDLSLRTRLVRLAAAVDLGRTALELKGLSVGLLAGVPGTTSDLRVRVQGFTVVDSHETHEIGLTPGVHWRSGERDWFAVGAFFDVERHHQKTDLFDPFTFASSQRQGTSNAWFSRVGTSVLPFVPLDLADSSSVRGEYLGWVRIGADIEYRNVSAMGAPTRRQTIGYLGVETPLLPDAWNPLSRYLRVHLLGGVDTSRGWGVGAGLYGSGVMQFLSCNPAYSSRPLAKSLGNLADVWSATCAVVMPL
ncbi:MAG: hypothetical protein HY270_14285 [Deltaproteobacteria bacterium]|nr:hypothetical protein [Deltaproteobacteria bacterium]